MTQSTGKYYVYDIPARHDKLIQYINIKTVIQYPMKSKKYRYKFEQKILLIPHLNFKDHVDFSFIICFFLIEEYCENWENFFIAFIY